MQLEDEQPDDKKTTGFDKVHQVYGNNNISTVPSIYQSPVMCCIFTVGAMDQQTEYKPVWKSDDGLWCGPESGVNVWSV